jgi:DNA processing protein
MPEPLSPPHPDRLRQWLTLAHLPGLGARRRLELLEHFGSIEALFDTPRGLLERVLPGAREAIETILTAADSDRHAPALEWLAQDRHYLVTWQDADYPRLLREIADPPLALYVLGERAALTATQFAIVGSRNPTPVGKENAFAFATALATAGLAITSGLALGIDGEAHRGALAAKGRTLAVTGTGLDRVYPAAHRELAHAIAEHGALVSEFPLGTPPRPENFPVRNRLIAGLSIGTLVVEAALQSGSLITARLATESGREVFAIPGSIHSPQARGCHALIRQGAKLVETAQDILEELGALARFVAAGNDNDTAVPAENLDGAQARVLDSLGHDAASVDQLVERSGLTAPDVSSILLELELRGLVTPVTGGRYHRVYARHRAGE